MNLRFIDWIWHIRGSLPLAPGQSSDEAFDRLDPLFRQSGTSFERADDTLTFSKRNSAAQDKMSIFDSGVLRIEPEAGGAVLRYHLISRALLFCFLAPLLFLAFAQLTLAVTILDKPTAEELAKKKKEKEEAKKKAERPLHPIDKFLGAPAPEKDKKDEKKDEKNGKKDGKKDEEDKKHSPKPAYIFAGLFAALYVVGRILEQWLIRSVFRRHLSGASMPDRASSLAN